MFVKRNNFIGAKFEYNNGSCNASGEYRFIGDNLDLANINGTMMQDGVPCAFAASVDSQGGVNIYGVAEVSALVAIATEVSAIIAAIKAGDEDVPEVEDSPEVEEAPEEEETPNEE